MRNLLLRSLTVASVAFAAGKAVAQPVALPPAPAGVEVTHQDGYEFVTVFDPTATGYPNSTMDWTGASHEFQGRGVTTEPFRISRTEVTTGQWIQFLNAFSSREMPQSIRDTLFTPVSETFFGGPTWWGARPYGDNSNNQTTTWLLRTDVSNAADLPVYGISWHAAALYCNWLNNGRSNDWNQLLGGAYDTSTWGRRPDGTFTDSLTHEAGAHYWIPTLDQWVMATYWDPNRNGPGQGGFWQSVNASDAVPFPGWPGAPGATTSAGIPIYVGDASSILEIPVASYPGAQSPWGLLDTSGGATELTEEPTSEVMPGQYQYRMALGATSGLAVPDMDPLHNNLLYTRIFTGWSNALDSADYEGLRIVTVIPTTGAPPLLLLSAVSLFRRWRS